MERNSAFLELKVSDEKDVRMVRNRLPSSLTQEDSSKAVSFEYLKQILKPAYTQLLSFPLALACRLIGSG
jgi:hypothetical protein